MIKLTGGEWKGRKIHTPKGSRTRPSPARLREAVFDIVGHHVHNRVFLDLFAGSGAMGLEALSRGASLAVFVEKARPALAELRKNLEMLGAEERALVIGASLPGALEGLPFSDWDRCICFVDPPYYKDMAIDCLKWARQKAADAPLFPSCEWLVQTENKATLPDFFSPWKLARIYPYGDSKLYRYQDERG